jgi:hypothetical protein
MFGGGASSTAFGPRGTQTVTKPITAAISFFLIAFLFSSGIVEAIARGR